jgi:4'-phosphopantetheinyl transferase EntD
MSTTQLADAGFSGTARVEQRLIESLCPSATVVVASQSAGTAPDLFPEEEAAVANALETRRTEFSWGRACAREALRRLGVAPQAIPMLADRAPGWPPGVVGSVAHADGLVCAVVACKDVIAGIGIDFEALDRPLRPGIDRFIRTPAERIAQQGLPIAIDPMRLVFSAKEAIHKCVAPMSGVTLGFHDVEVDIDVNSQGFRARLVRSRDRVLPDFGMLVGRFAISARFVVTTAVIRAECGSCATITPASLVGIQ